MEEGEFMELLYIAGIIMMVAIVLKIGFVVYKNFIQEKKDHNDKNLDL